MDCHQAQAELDLATHGRDAVGRTEAQAAMRHLAECDACHLAVESQQQFDAQIARAMSDVPLPSGLNERLIAAIETTGVQPKVSPVHHPRSRSWMAGAIALLIPLLIWAWLAPRTPALNRVHVAELAALNLNELPVDSTPMEPVPSGWSSLRAIQFGDQPRRSVVNRVSAPVLAFLAVPDRRSPQASGFLIKLTSAQWQSVPEATSFSSATIQYEAFGTWVVWQEGDSVYLCILHGDAHVMQQLQDMIAGHGGLT